MARILHFDATACRNLRSLLAQATEELENKYGIKFDFGAMSYTPKTVSMKVNIFLSDPSTANDSPLILRYQNNVRKHGYKFGMTESMLGQNCNC